MKVLKIILNLLLPIILFFGISSILIFGILGEGASFSEFSEKYGLYVNIGYFALGILQLYLVYRFLDLERNRKLLLIFSIIITYILMFLKFF